MVSGKGFKDLLSRRELSSENGKLRGGGHPWREGGGFKVGKGKDILVREGRAYSVYGGGKYVGFENRW